MDDIDVTESEDRTALGGDINIPPNDASANDDSSRTTTPEKKVHPALHLIGPAYARNKSFWISIIFSTIPQGLFMALVALAFFNAFEQLSKATWLTEEYEHAMHPVVPDGAGDEHMRDLAEELGNIDMLRVGNGQWWYVGMLAGAGACVGLVKVIWTYLLARSHPFPDKAPSMVQELAELRAHDALICIPVAICSAIGIGLGVSTGPEAALGCVGTSLGSGFVAHRRQHWLRLQRWWRRKRSEMLPSSLLTQSTPDTEDDDKEQGNLAPYLFPDLTADEQLCALDGMAAAFGALFPAQYLSPMLIHEIGFLWGPEGAPQTKYHFMETVIRTGIASSVAYALFVGLKDRTFLEQAVLPQAAFDLLPVIEVKDMFHAAILGIICGGVGLLGIFFLGIGGAVGGKCNKALDSLGAKLGLPERFLGMLMTPVVGGTLLGLIAKGCPLTLGDGAHQLGFIVTHGRNLGAGDLAANMFAKLGAVAISLGFGFVGGQIFPLIFAGACLGTLTHQWVSDVSLVVSVSSCMCAVPCAFMPALFTFTTLISMVLVLGGAATTPVFVAAITSYTTVCGLGILQDVAAMAAGDEPSSSNPAHLPAPNKQHDDKNLASEEERVEEGMEQA